MLLHYYYYHYIQILCFHPQLLHLSFVPVVESFSFQTATTTRTTTSTVDTITTTFRRQQQQQQAVSSTNNNKHLVSIIKSDTQRRRRRRRRWITMSVKMKDADRVPISTPTVDSTDQTHNNSSEDDMTTISISQSQQRSEKVQLQSSSTTETSSSSSSSSNTNSPLQLSSKIISTVDPCVVLMKQFIVQYQKEYEQNNPNNSIMYSLAQGIVYWEPPSICNDYIIQSLTTRTTSTTNNESTNGKYQSKMMISNSKIHLYTPDEGCNEIQQLLLHKIQNENQLTNHDIIVTSGANQAYMNCVLTLLSSPSSSSSNTIHSNNNNNNTVECNCDDHYAVVFAPYYFNHYMALQMTIGTDHILIGNHVRMASSTSSDSSSLSDLIPDLDWLEQQFITYNTVADSHDNTKRSKRSRIQMVTITNPCNPTGIAYTKEQIQPFVDLCRTYNCYLILDATYEYFVYNNSNDDNAFTACFNNEEHVIHIFSFSKSYAMAGYRIGYIAIPRRGDNTNQLYNNLLKVQDTITIAPSHIGQIAAIGAMSCGRKWVQEQINTLIPSKNYIIQALYNAFPQQTLNIIGGSGAMYIMVQLPNLYVNTFTSNVNESNNEVVVDDIEIAKQLIRNYGIAIIPGTYCGTPGWIRICYANLPPEQCILAAQRLQLGLSKIYNTHSRLQG